MSVGIYVSKCRAHADTVGIVHWEWPDSAGVGVVVVIGLGIPSIEASSVKGDLKRRPRFRLMPADRDRSVEPVEVVTYIRIRFQFPKIWK